MPPIALRLLIIDARSARTPQLECALAAAGFQVLDVVSENGPVHRRVSELQPDAIIIDSESPTRDTLEGLALVGRKFPRPIVMLSDQGGTDLVRDAAQLGISAYVIEGVSSALVRSLIEVSIVHFRCQRLLQTELEQTQIAFADQRSVDTVKCLLMEREGLTEQLAYQRLRKLAMDRGQRIADVARGVLAGMI
ncbi:MAG: ANTAR domain-containing protein [Nevskia sp.]